MSEFSVVFADATDQSEIDWAQDLLPAPGIRLQSPTDDRPDSLISLLRGAQAVVTRYRSFSTKWMDASPKLQLIQRFSTRWDGIDLDAARQRGIHVATMPLHGAIAVAELAIALILALSKNLILAHRQTSEADYLERGIEPIVTDEHRYRFNWMQIPNLHEVHGKTLGVMGFGEIGTETARRAQALGMRVIYNKRTQLETAVERAEAVAFRSKDELIAESDFLLLSTPLTFETRGMIGRRELAMMKPGSYLVNVAKGAVLDEAALVEALRSGPIAGAGLDVFVQEPLPADHPLLACDNVILTPHIGGGTGGAKEKQMRALLDNIQRFVDGKPIQHRVA